MTPFKSLKLLRVVTLASASGAYGGPFDTACEQARALAESDCAVALLAGRTPGAAMPACPAGVRAHLVPVRRLLPLPGFAGLFGLRYAVTLLRLTWRSDIVHVSLALECIPLSAAYVAIALGRRLVVQPHGMLTTTGRRSAFRRFVEDLIFRPVLRSARVVFCLTDDEASRLRERFGHVSTTTLGNPIRPEYLDETPSHYAADSRLPLGQGVDRPTVVSAARLHPRKRPDLFLDAARISRERGQDIRYVLAGPDSHHLSEVLRNRFGDLFSASYIGSLSRTDLAALIRAADVFVLPSEDEPWGNVLIGALASGKPVVISDSAALAGPVTSAGAGILFEDGDSASLVEAVYSALADPERYATMSENALCLANEIADPKLLHQKLKMTLTQLCD